MADTVFWCDHCFNYAKANCWCHKYTQFDICTHPCTHIHSWQDKQLLMLLCNAHSTTYDLVCTAFTTQQVSAVGSLGRRGITMQSDHFPWLKHSQRISKSSAYRAQSAFMRALKDWVSDTEPSKSSPCSPHSWLHSFSLCSPSLLQHLSWTFLRGYIRSVSLRRHFFLSITSSTYYSSNVFTLYFTLSVFCCPKSQLKPPTTSIKTEH